MGGRKVRREAGVIRVIRVKSEPRSACRNRRSIAFPAQPDILSKFRARRDCDCTIASVVTSANFLCIAQLLKGGPYIENGPAIRCRTRRNGVNQRSCRETSEITASVGLASVRSKWTSDLEIGSPSASCTTTWSRPPCFASYRAVSARARASGRFS
jgi:hypothetical protein